MREDNIAAYAIFNSHAHAGRCVNALLDEGFRQEDVSVLAQEEQAGLRDFAAERNMVQEGTATGAATGGVIGGALGLLAGAGIFSVPGVGIFIAAGPLLATVAGFGAGAAAGGIVGAIAGVGIPEYEARRYQSLVNDGGVLLSVYCADADQALNAKAIMEENGGQDIASAGGEAVEAPIIIPAAGGM